MVYRGCVYDGVPTDAAIIDVNTQWAAGKVLSSTTRTINMAPMHEFLNVNIAGTGNLSLPWTGISCLYPLGSFDETDMEDTVFSGKWENSGLWASGAGTIRLTQFYELRNQTVRYWHNGYT